MLFFIGFLQLYYLIPPVHSTYDPSQKHFRENFDPNEADPKRNISCVGDSYDLRLPLINGFNPNGLSMQKLCAKPQYRGGERYQHAGGYCYYPAVGMESSDHSDFELPQTLDEVFRGLVVFDGHPGAQISHQLQNPRVLQACLYRCFCNYGIRDVSIQPTFEVLNKVKVASDKGYQLQIDINNDFTVPESTKKGPTALLKVDSTPIIKKPQIDRLGHNWPGRPVFMNLDPGNEIECIGDLPNFALPIPFSPGFFSTIQELCAVALSGGHLFANAGGYCHRSFSGSSSTPDVEKTVWFSDSMTPRYDWTWGGGNFFAVASIRFHCWRHCKCKGSQPRNPDTTKLWHFLNSLQLGLQDDGSVDLELVGMQLQQQVQGQGQGQNQGTNSSGLTQQVLPPQPVGAIDSPSGTCGRSSNEFCPKQWDVVSWGPIPRDPPNATDIVSPTPPKPGTMGICGNACTGPQDCGTTDGQYNCSCAFPSDSDARILGLDPVAPVAVCIALLATAVGGS